MQPVTDTLYKGGGAGAIEAIKAAEKAIAEHKDTVLLAMATGTGKRRTVLGMIYRFLEAGRFKRVLYLVDRTSLGDQTMDTIREVKLKELLTLNQMYDVKSLEDKVLIEVKTSVLDVGNAYAIISRHEWDVANLQNNRNRLSFRKEVNLCLRRADYDSFKNRHLTGWPGC